ncbi:hypothetical protein V8B55DRAFT_1540181 [Mucor lusitanicus]|uniref:Uncharacterized protein n=2 Tax=Mucor circinelloides f. lusitanicus TaxID=29924 RepID=A0A168NB09_MUCCL|nr:hypothetical protein FB192DRAFT_1449131 [Mucor lusitanicus]OAD06043.1 hypothetical protein MUCCIDRAFT_106602 [Mucor lusitanicus CBS 277.49]
MEAFLTTLPPYVHEFLDKYPPTDVFNLLRELICFAVLYSEDRDKLNQSTSDFLKKRQQPKDGQHAPEKDDITQEKEEEEEEEEEDATVPVEKRIDSIAEETEHEIQTLKAKPLYNVRTGEAIQTDKSNMPNTFPEWWGHRESEPHKVERKETAVHHGEHEDKTPPQQHFGSSWISWENQQPNSTPTTTNHRMERARSQIIPDLRSYLVEDSKLTTSRTAPPSNSSSAAANHKKRYSLNTTASKAMAIVPPPNASTSKAAAAVATPKRRISSPPVCDSPVTATAPATPSSKFIQTAAKQQQLRQNKTIPPSSSGTSTAPPTRSASVILKQPRQNAAMRARAEHARQQQEELERKKSAPAIGSSTSLRLKQRVNSGIDWESIKRDRRKTVAEAPSTAAASKE